MLLNSKLKVAAASWSMLGFYRGMQSYDYKYRKFSNQTQTQTPYFYSSRIGYGILGVVLYINPALIFLAGAKEIYRLEVNIRGMEDEKKSPEYNDII
jgi:hypothetical protein